MKDSTTIIVLAAAAALGFVAWKVSKAAASGALNPASRDNIVYQAVNTVGGSLSTDGVTGRTADGKWSFGAWVYDKLHPATATARDNWNVTTGTSDDQFRASERAYRAGVTLPVTGEGGAAFGVYPSAF